MATETSHTALGAAADSPLYRRDSANRVARTSGDEMKLNVWRFAVAVTAAFSALYVACALAVALFPEPTFDFFNTWFHGLDINLMKPAGGRPLTVTQFIEGWLAVVVVALPAGSLLAWIYNALARPVRIA